ncbi:uncharacterized protein LOC111408542 [Olea europaea var. sylvestris]|uniref:uncharacterized protein LOC111408542 n=1 Tax=Olea europaea var. sylvestris TaxID=158386 RepID=UPI000C1D2F3A|nr:uncharacterized protein LOC111408542 [Olea europaea var. sylvestris]
MIKGALVTCKGTKRNGIYVTTAEIVKNSTSSINLTNTDDTHKWHNRLAHISIKGLKLLNDKGVFGKDCVSNMPFCNHCVLGKHHRSSFSSGMHKTTKVLEYIHTDLWGPATNPTMGGCGCIC